MFYYSKQPSILISNKPPKLTEKFLSNITEFLASNVTLSVFFTVTIPDVKYATNISIKMREVCFRANICVTYISYREIVT